MFAASTSRAAVSLSLRSRHICPLAVGLGSVPLTPCLHLLRDQEADEANSDDKDNAEDNDDTGFPASPVAALGNVRDSVVEDDGAGVDGRHFEGVCVVCNKNYFSVSPRSDYSNVISYVKWRL